MIRPVCKACETLLGRNNQSGFCQYCYPEFRVVHVAETKAKPVLPVHKLEPGLLKKDAAYREQMEQANRQFVARLAMAMAA